MGNLHFIVWRSQAPSTSPILLLDSALLVLAANPGKLADEQGAEGPDCQGWYPWAEGVFLRSGGAQRLHLRKQEIKKRNNIGKMPSQDNK